MYNNAAYATIRITSMLSATQYARLYRASRFFAREDLFGFGRVSYKTWTRTFPSSTTTLGIAGFGEATDAHGLAHDMMVVAGCTFNYTVLA